MKIKICGVCHPGDAAVAAQCGADYIGVILATKGPRQQSMAQAREIFNRAGGALRVGVFADQSAAFVSDAAGQLGLDVVQLHGGESPSFAAEVQRQIHGRVWKMIAPQNSEDVERAVADYADVVQGLLFDHSAGGSGRTFDWSVAADARGVLPPNVQLIVAGGLNPTNVRAAVEMLRPDVVDVASGVEDKPCEKSRTRIEAFVRNARS